MKKGKSKEQEFHSMEEYEKKYYPEFHAQKVSQVKDINKIGFTMAKESLGKVKQMIQKNKICL
ncbi:MAG: hypothetical protein HY787_15360 [Deltaproteobacteria bacterium]|nr:hypothetical protein [Deltaproteobacteria bacterium]